MSLIRYSLSHWSVRSLHCTYYNQNRKTVVRFAFSVEVGIERLLTSVELTSLP